jgi:heme oxygenase
MELAALPRCSCIPRVDGTSRALGCMYVLEGSTLGGRIIARKLQQHLAIDADTGAAFFQACGNETGTRWSYFVARLNREPLPSDDVRAAAFETFDRLERWLLERGAPTW